MIPPGAWSPTVTQHVAGTPSTDAYGDEFPASFTDRALAVIADYPGNPIESDSPAGDIVTADRVLLVDPFVTVSEYDQFTASDGLRYKVAGAPSRYQNPWTGTAVTQVNLRRVT